MSPSPLTKKNKVKPANDDVVWILSIFHFPESEKNKILTRYMRAERLYLRFSFLVLRFFLSSFFFFKCISLSIEHNFGMTKINETLQFALCQLLRVNTMALGRSIHIHSFILHSFINITLLCGRCCCCCCFLLCCFGLLFCSILACCFSFLAFYFFHCGSRFLCCVLSGAFGFFGKRLYSLLFVRSLSTIFHRNSVSTCIAQRIARTYQQTALAAVKRPQIGYASWK